MEAKKPVTFKKLKFKPLNGGIQAIIKYPNGYGASIVQHSFSYGNQEGLFELAVLKNDKLCYDTPITNDVLGWLKESDIDKTLVDIFNLPPSRPDEA